MSGRKIKVYLVTGEPSGDLLASRLMRALIRQTKGDVLFAGVGGESMRQSGLKTLFPISDLAVMGFWEVLPSLPKIMKRIHQTLDDIEKKKPDIVVTVDSWSFSKQIHLGLKKRGITIPHIHYVAPQVWAWKAKRAKQIKKWVDHLLMLLPFEEKYFKPHNVPCTYVGHPVVEGGADKGSSSRFLKKHHLSPKDFILTVLPGSRKNEIKYLLPIFKQVVCALKKEQPTLKIVIPTVETVEHQIREELKNWPVDVLVVKGEAERYDAFAASSLALAASGTVSLELAMAGVPHVICYRVSRLTGFIARHAIKIKFVNLINILAGKEIIPELLQENCNCHKILQRLKELMTQKGTKQKKEMQDVLKKLGVGDKLLPSEKASYVIKGIIEKNEQ